VFQQVFEGQAVKQLPGSRAVTHDSLDVVRNRLAIRGDLDGEIKCEAGAGITAETVAGVIFKEFPRLIREIIGAELEEYAESLLAVFSGVKVVEKFAQGRREPGGIAETRHFRVFL